MLLKKPHLRKGVQVDLGDLHLRQDLPIDGHGCFKYLARALPLMLQLSSCLHRQTIDRYFWSWQPPFLFLPLKTELGSTLVIFLSHNNASIHIPELCFSVSVQGVLLLNIHKIKRETHQVAKQIPTFMRLSKLQKTNQNFQGSQIMANKFLDHSDSCEVLDLKIATRFLCEYNNIETCLHTLPSAQVTLAECCYSIEKKSTDRWVILYH